MKKPYRDSKFLHHAVRVGHGGKTIVVTKLRTMKPGAYENEKDVYPKGNTIDVTSSVRDPRVTAFGKFLRRAHIDEVPQIFSVLSGKLRLVGIRPQRRGDFRNYPSHIKEMYKEMGPGLVGIGYACNPFPPSKEALHKEYERFYRMWKKSHTKAYMVYAWKIFWNKVRGRAPAV